MSRCVDCMEGGECAAARAKGKGPAARGATLRMARVLRHGDVTRRRATDPFRASWRHVKSAGGTCGAFSADGRFLAVGTADRGVAVLDTGTLVAEVGIVALPARGRGGDAGEAPCPRVTAVAWAPNSRLLVAATEQADLLCIDVQRGAILCTFRCAVRPACRRPPQASRGVTTLSPPSSTSSPATSLEWLAHSGGSVLVAFQKGLPAVLDVERCQMQLLAEAADGGGGDGLVEVHAHPCGPATWRFEVDDQGEAAGAAASPETGDHGSTPSSKPAAPGASRLQFACCACSLQAAQGDDGHGGGAPTPCVAITSTTGALTLLRLHDGRPLGRRTFPAQLHLGLCASPSGTMLALSTQMAVRLLEVAPELPPVARLRDAVAPQPYTRLAFTADGNGLVASPGHKGRDRGRVVHAWRLDVAHEVLHADVEGGVTAVLSHPARNALAAIEADGGFLLWREQPAPSDWPVRACSLVAHSCCALTSPFPSSSLPP